MASPKEIIQKGLSKLKAAPTDEAEDALETLNRESDVGKKINQKYHNEMPVSELKADIKEDMSKPQTKEMKADIKEDKTALKKKIKPFIGGGIQPKGTTYIPNKRIQN